MSLNGKAYIVGAYEHPTRKADELSVVRLHADVAKGALDDAGLSKDDIDAYFCAGDAPGLGAMTMADYLGLTAAPRRLDRMWRFGADSACRACGSRDRCRPLQRRPDHAGGTAACGRRSAVAQGAGS